jgi:hypothetical protein
MVDVIAHPVPMPIQASFGCWRVMGATEYAVVLTGVKAASAQVRGHFRRTS